MNKSPVKLQAVIIIMEIKKLKANFRLPCKKEYKDLLAKFVALTSKNTNTANSKVNDWPAISAMLTTIASMPAKEAIIELKINPDWPNNIKQIFVTNFTAIKRAANFNAGTKEKIFSSFLLIFSLPPSASF